MSDVRRCVHGKLIAGYGAPDDLVCEHGCTVEAAADVEQHYDLSAGRRVTEVPLGELLRRQQRVMDAALAFIDRDGEFLRARTSGLVRGSAVMSARTKRDAAKDELRDAVRELRGEAAT